MKYYCQNCGTEIVFREGWYYPNCKTCGQCALTPIPKYETVDQWEERTGREYPNTAPVWVKTDTGAFWKIATYGNHKFDKCIVATESGALPKDWRPE